MKTVSRKRLIAPSPVRWPVLLGVLAASLASPSRVSGQLESTVLRPQCDQALRDISDRGNFPYRPFPMEDSRTCEGSHPKQVSINLFLRSFSWSVDRLDLTSPDPIYVSWSDSLDAEVAVRMAGELGGATTPTYYRLDALAPPGSTGFVWDTEVARWINGAASVGRLAVSARAATVGATGDSVYHATNVWQGEREAPGCGRVRIVLLADTRAEGMSVRYGEGRDGALGEAQVVPGAPFLPGRPHEIDLSKGIDRPGEFRVRFTGYYGLDSIGDSILSPEELTVSVPLEYEGLCPPPA